MSQCIFLPKISMSDSISFSDLSLPSYIINALNSLNYETPSPIQAESIPPLMDGKDLIGQAQTGTGKTAAFSIPALSKMDQKQKKPQMVVIAPTRELAAQVAEAIESFARYMKGVQVLPIYGGQGYEFQLRSLKRGPQVIVGTPGRVLDHLKRGSLDLKAINYLVLDEADEMLKMGFIDDVETIMSHAPDTCQIAMFSATMPEPIKRIARNYLKDPVEIKIKSKTTTVENIDQSYLKLHRSQKMEALSRILEIEEYQGAILFVKTRSMTVEVADKLADQGFSAAALNGDMSQSQRESTVNRLKEGRLDILVATDVAARGLDVDRLNLVINYDIPEDAEPYVHRIGRTGRAGRSGKAILFVSSSEIKKLKAIERVTGQTIVEGKLPAVNAVEKKRSDAFKAKILDTMAKEPLDFYFNYMKNLKDEMGLTAEQLVPALIHLAQKESPLQVKDMMTNLRPVADNRSDRNDSRRKNTRKKDQGSSRKGSNRAKGIQFNSYRLEIGKKHQVRVGDIVGAIANEARIDSEYIGNIKLYEDYSVIELPEGMPKSVFQHLKKIYVRQRKMNLTPIAG